MIWQQTGESHSRRRISRGEWTNDLHHVSRETRTDARVARQCCETWQPDDTSEAASDETSRWECLFQEFLITLATISRSSLTEMVCTCLCALECVLLCVCVSVFMLLVVGVSVCLGTLMRICVLTCVCVSVCVSTCFSCLSVCMFVHLLFMFLPLRRNSRGEARATRVKRWRGQTSTDDKPC